MFIRAFLTICAILFASVAASAPLRYTAELTGFPSFTNLGFPASGTIVFDLDFDFASNQTFIVDSRISLVSSTFLIGSALGFSYSKSLDQLVVSGAATGIGVSSVTDDFYISIFSVNTPSSPSYFVDVSVAQIGLDDIASYNGTVTREPLTPIPLPASAGLLAVGLMGLGLARRRARRETA